MGRMFSGFPPMEAVKGPGEKADEEQGHEGQNDVGRQITV